MALASWRSCILKRDLRPWTPNLWKFTLSTVPWLSIPSDIVYKSPWLARQLFSRCLVWFPPLFLLWRGGLERARWNLLWVSSLLKRFANSWDLISDDLKALWLFPPPFLGLWDDCFGPPPNNARWLALWRSWNAWWKFEEFVVFCLFLKLRLFGLWWLLCWWWILLVWCWCAVDILLSKEAGKRQKIKKIRNCFYILQSVWCKLHVHPELINPNAFINIFDWLKPK